MPRIVNHDERRAQIASVVEQLVYDDGIRAVTIREVAGRVGYSTTVVSHYFSSKMEMLVYTHRRVRQRAEDLIEAGLREGWALAETLERLLPISEERWRDWHTWFAFWGMTPAEPTVADEWREGTTNANQLFVRLITVAQSKGELPAALDPFTAATRLQIYINGMASLVAQDRNAWPADRQTAMLRDLLKELAVCCR